MIRRVAMLSVHTCPLAMLGGKETGGMNVYVRELSAALDRRGIAVDVFTRAQEPGTPVVHGVLGERSRVIHIPAGPERPYSKHKVYNHLPEFVEGVRARAVRENLHYDIIHSHYWLSGLAAQRLQDVWGGTPIVQMFHTLGEMKNRVAQTNGEREPDFRIRSEGKIIRFADRLIAATPVEQHDLVSLYGADPANIAVIPPGVNLNLFQPVPRPEARRRIGVPPDHKVILFVGRIQPLKGIDCLIRAMALVLKHNPEFRHQICISIIGGNPHATSGEEQREMRRLYNLKEALNVGDLVTFLGAKNQDTLVNYYSAAQMVVMPSHYESFGMVAVEAMACRTPVIASDVGGLTYTVQDGFNGYLVPKKDVRALAEKITLLLKYNHLRDHLGEQARHWVERFRWEYIAEQMLAVYNDTLTQHSNFVAAPMVQWEE